MGSVDGERERERERDKILFKMKKESPYIPVLRSLGRGRGYDITGTPVS